MSCLFPHYFRLAISIFIVLAERIGENGKDIRANDKQKRNGRQKHLTRLLPSSVSILYVGCGRDGSH